MRSLVQHHPLLREFHFGRLGIEGIDNEPFFALNCPSAREQEFCAFHRSFSDGDAYVRHLMEKIQAAVANRSPLPVVRFADGEFALYSLSLKCNGLYDQAPSLAAIKAALPLHIKALRDLGENGLLAPLIFPENAKPLSRFPYFWNAKTNATSATRFLNFLKANRIHLTAENYIPFYCVYACLSGKDFLSFLNAKNVLVVNSDFKMNEMASWFSRFDSIPQLNHAKIPRAHVATNWASMRDQVLCQIQTRPDLILVGAGAGALPVCVDLAMKFSAPAIDAGHVINMMNNMEQKSSGPRLFTYPR